VTNELEEPDAGGVDADRVGRLVRYWNSLHARHCRDQPEMNLGALMDQEFLGRFREALKEPCKALQLRVVSAIRQNRVQDQTEVTDEGDRGSAETERGISGVQQTQVESELLAINEALDRIDTGSFGTCLSCGQEISAIRLNPIPWAQYCITCQELMSSWEGRRDG
jgi:DnaK suppressor protein